MKFAHFSHVWNKTGMSPHQRYEQEWREIQLCDELGFDYAFCVEHHFRPDESWMSAPSLFTAAAGAKTKNIRIGAMGYIVGLYNPLRLVEEIAIADQMLGGRLEIGLVPGINPAYFEPFGERWEDRKSPTLEFVDYLRTAYCGQQPFSYHGENYHTDGALIAVQPVQQPHPPLWMQSRDEETLEFCARNGIHSGYFLVFPRHLARPVYEKFVADWKKAGWDHKPNVAYSTLVYVDETDEKALEVAKARSARAYAGFLPPREGDETFEELLEKYVDAYRRRGDLKTVETRLKIFDADYLIDNDIVFIGSPETVARKLKEASTTGMFNTFMGEFNFSDLEEEDLMRSIRLFGEQVMPALRDHEPF